MQYFSLLVLALGVAIVQLSSIESKGASVEGQNQFIGLLAVFFSCCTSGAAGVYFEKMLKSTNNISVYMRNCQLSTWSILLGLVPVFCNDFDEIREHGFFAGYDAVVVGVIVSQAMTGLIVALVMKYADTILKGFATSVAVVLATVLSIFIWNANCKVDFWFLIGAAMVMWAVRLYSNYPTGSTREFSPFAVFKKNLLSTIFLFGGIMMLIAQVSILSSVPWSSANLPTSVEMQLHEFSKPTQTSSNAFVDSTDPQDANSLHKIDDNDMQCQMRDISGYTEYKRWDHKGDQTERWAHCSRFQCLNDQAVCDNAEPTNFGGPEPPCCVHILRDVGKSGL